MLTASRQLPRYQCHKKVWALKIAAIEFGQDGSAKIAPKDEGFSTFQTDAGFKRRWGGSEEDLGYLVIYEGGFQSWSPTSAFEEGYSRL